MRANWLKKSSFKITRVSHGENYPTLLLSRPSHPHKVKTVINKSLQVHNTLLQQKSKILSFQEHQTLTKWKLPKSCPYRTISPAKMKLIQKQSFQTQHTLSNWTIKNQSFYEHHMIESAYYHKISPFRTTTPFQSEHVQNSVLARLAHPLWQVCLPEDLNNECAKQSPPDGPSVTIFHIDNDLYLLGTGTMNVQSPIYILYFINLMMLS